MAFYRCDSGNGGGSSWGAEEEIIKAQKISDTAGGGTYLYPIYPDLTQTDYEAVIVKIYMTKSDVYYERYISFALKDLNYTQSGINVYDSEGNAYALSLTITFSATAVTYLTYQGSWETIYIDMYGVKDGTIVEKITLAEWDFKSSLVDSIKGYSVVLSGSSRTDADGIKCTNNTARAEIPIELLQCDTFYEIKTGTMSPSFAEGQHGRVFSFRQQGQSGNINHGLAWRQQTGVWSIWDADNLWQDSTITDKDYFSNCTLTIEITADNNWKIYRNGIFVFGTTLPLPYSDCNQFTLGSNAQSYYNMNIEGLKIYKTKVISSGGSVSKTQLISETDFANLSTKDSDTLYEVYHNDFGTQIVGRYQGDKRILNYINDTTGYEFWYEDVACISHPNNKESNQSETIDLMDWNDFIARDWQLEFNATSLLNASESCVFGTTSSALEIYFNSSNNLCIYGFGPDTGISGCNGHDVKITFNHTTKETNVYCDDVLVQTFTATANSESGTRVQLFNYRSGRYLFFGIVKYIGFKWL